jgi:hypothetical protein
MSCFASVQNHEAKFYISEDSIFIKSNTIYVNIEGNITTVSSIASDENGLYISSPDLKWGYCQKCGFYHNDTARCPR